MKTEGKAGPSAVIPVESDYEEDNFKVEDSDGYSSDEALWEN